MNTAPRISIIVLSYNQELTIARTLDSILVQNTTHPIEIIIGDDCSTDSTRSICEQYKVQHPELIRLMPLAENKGLIGNYIDCLTQCKGDFAAGCAGDDWWNDDNKIQKQVDFLIANPEYVVVHGAMKHYNVQSLQISEPRINDQLLCDNINEKLYFKHLINAPTACIRRSAIDNIDFEAWREQKFAMEDLPLWLELSLHGKFHFIPEYLTTYSTGGESISNSGNYKKQIAFERETIKIKLYYYDMQKPQFARKKLDQLFHKRIIDKAIKSNDKELIRTITEEVGLKMAWKRKVSTTFKRMIGKI